MKKLITMFIVGTLVVSCNATTPSQDTEMLQKKYPKSIVNRLDGFKYIVADSTNVFEIRVGFSGDITSIVKIK
ncbi:MAG TPA: hypothetical protein PKD00_07110 [Burkholderiales bacterium]|nr:hypothetical protein [Burkholderiales bacterium]